MTESLFTQFKRIVFLDTETTGIDFRRDRIIELAAFSACAVEEGYRIEDEMDDLIRLPQGRNLPAEIVRLTGITDAMLQNTGVADVEACERFAALLETPGSLLVAYNAQFDLCFLYYFLHHFGRESVLRNVRLLDAMTVYKDRRPYPHRLANAVEAYALKTQNTHRAIDDARATMELLQAMEAERPDLEQYINLFGYNPRYGISGPRISSVTYLPQYYDSPQRLYEQQKSGAPG